MPQHWLLPVDDSEVCEHALAWAIAELLGTDHEVHLLHVLPLRQGINTDGLSGTGDVVLTTDVKSDQAQMERAKAFMQRRFLPLLQGKVHYQAEVVHFETDAESIGEVVCARADAIQAKGIVLAKHNRGMISDLILGSVTRYCSQHARQAVIMYQQTAMQQEQQ